MARPARTPLHLLENRRGDRAPVAPQVSPGGEPPPFPLLDTEHRSLARRAWESIWSSPVAKLIDPVADAVPLELWMRDLDEFERISELADEAPVVRQANGTIRPNPLYARLGQLARQLRQWEDRFGLTPRGRQMLRVQSGADPLAQVLAAINAPLDDDLDAEVDIDG